MSQLKKASTSKLLFWKQKSNQRSMNLKKKYFLAGRSLAINFIWFYRRNISESNSMVFFIAILVSTRILNFFWKLNDFDNFIINIVNVDTSSNHLFQFYRGRSRVRLLGPDVRPVQGSGVGRHHLHRPQETTTHLFALVTSMAYNKLKLLIAVLWHF